MSRPIEKLRDVPLDALAYSVDEAAERIAIGKTTFEELLSSGAIKSIKVGRRRIVTRRALEEFLTKTEKAA